MPHDNDQSKRRSWKSEKSEVTSSVTLTPPMATNREALQHQRVVSCTRYIVSPLSIGLRHVERYESTSRYEYSAADYCTYTTRRNEENDNSMNSYNLHSSHIFTCHLTSTVPVNKILWDATKGFSLFTSMLHEMKTRYAII